MPGKTQGIVSMVCGLVSIFGSYSFGVGFVLAIVGLVMNKKVASSSSPCCPLEVGKLSSIIGPILSIIGLILGIVFAIAAAAIQNS